MRRLVPLLLLAVATAAPAATPAGTCLDTSGGAATRCLDDWLDAVQTCRGRADAACETAARAAGGPLATATAAAGAATGDCDETTALTLGFQTVADVGLRAQNACGDWGEAFLDLAWSSATLDRRTLACQRVVAKSVDRVRAAVIRAYARGCYLRQANGGTCRRGARDRAVKKATAGARRRITRSCGARYATLGLDDDVDGLVTRATTLARHFAQQVYPPNDLGPTAELGPDPVGLRTIEISDPSRLNVPGTGPRPVTLEVYYPTTPEAVAGLPREIAQVLGVDVATLPAWRDVPPKPGVRPLIAFSHGSNGVRIQSFFFAAHLASHGYVVVSPDHHGNTFPDSLLGIVDPDVAVNRPKDLSFAIDTVLAHAADPEDPLHGAVDAARIGASGHSFGGYTAFALAGGAFANGTFTDARVKAIVPQAPFAPFPAGFYGTITIPTLVLGGLIDETTPYADMQQAPFDALPGGAAVVGLGGLHDAGHFTFSDYCEVDRQLLGFLGGFSEACEPRHLPFRHAHDIVNYLALNFFDAVLQGDADARARLDPAVVGEIEELDFSRK